MGDRRRGADHRYHERSPGVSRHRDRSSERYRERSVERYHSSRHHERSRSRSYSRDRRVDGYSSKYRNSSHRRSTSRGRYRSSRSRSPRHLQHSSRYDSSSRHRNRSRSNSPVSPSLHATRIKRERASPVEERVAPPPPSFPRQSPRSDASDSDDSENPSSARKLAMISSPGAACGSRNSQLGGQDNSNSESSTHFEQDTIEPIDKERIHREMEEKLRLALAKEGKIYPPPKPEASHPVFANDGSFLEIFKKMQEQMAQQQANAEAAELRAKNQLLCKRRGGKILKTGIVAKSRANDGSGDDPKDFWSIYLQEVKKYKNSSCDVDSQTRPLVK